MSELLSHINAQGQANMVDVTAKEITTRTATAEAYLYLSDAALAAVVEQQNQKGDVIATARIAGIQAAKLTPQLIPLCHPLALTKVAIDFAIEPSLQRIRIESFCKLDGKTGVEMEALTACSVAALTLFDMCKAADPKMRIEGLRVLHKSGGKTGAWRHD